MKPYLRHIGAICLSALLLLSTLSFTVNLHYCGKKLVEVAVNDEAQGCGMEMATENPFDAVTRAAMHCCESVKLAFEGQEDLHHSGDDISFAKFFAINLPGRFSFIPRFEIIQRTLNFREYSPPPLIRDLPVLNRTFLI